MYNECAFCRRMTDVLVKVDNAEDVKLIAENYGENLINCCPTDIKREMIDTLLNLVISENIIAEKYIKALVKSEWEQVIFWTDSTCNRWYIQRV